MTDEHVLQKIKSLQSSHKGRCQCCWLRSNHSWSSEPLTNHRSPPSPSHPEPSELHAERWAQGELVRALVCMCVCCVCVCVWLPCIKSDTDTQSTEWVCSSDSSLLFFFLLHTISVKKIKSKSFYFSSLDSHDVPLQRSAASSLSGFTASSRGSPRAPDPVTTLGLPGGGSPPAEPACHLPPPDFLLQKPGGRPPAQHAAGRLSPAVGTQRRADGAPELRPADPQQPRLSANRLPRLRLPQIRRPCDTGTVYTER